MKKHNGKIMTHNLKIFNKQTNFARPHLHKMPLQRKIMLVDI